METPAPTALPPEEEIPEVENLSPWEEVSDFLEKDDLPGLRAFLADLDAEDHRLVFSRLSAAERKKSFEALSVEEAADILDSLPESQAADLLEELPADLAADILEEIPSDQGAGLLREMSTRHSEEILGEIDDSEDADELRQLAAYDDRTAGGLMTSNVFAFSAQSTVGEVLNDLNANAEDYKHHDVQYLYVVTAEGVLTGVVPLRRLVLNSRGARLEDLLIPDPYKVRIEDSLEDLQEEFENHNFVGLPVVDSEGRLKGVVTRSTAMEATAEDQADDFRAVSGIVGGEELRSMPLWIRSTRRLSWLLPNILLNIAAASIIAAHQDTLEAVIALAVFLPMVSDMSGCSGNQAVAVSMRELTLGVLRPADFLRVLWKEGALGLINGTVLGITLGIIAAIWQGNAWLGAVIGGALALNTVLSVILGGLVPLLLKRFKIDPAVAAGPILTTCTDMAGFFLVLTLAASVIGKL